MLERTLQESRTHVRRSHTLYATVLRSMLAVVAALVAVDSAVRAGRVSAGLVDAIYVDTTAIRD